MGDSMKKFEQVKQKFVGKTVEPKAPQPSESKKLTVAELKKVAGAKPREGLNHSQCRL